MPTRLLLDGPDIESLLARVRDELGADARIVHADKVRTGGVAGFFARERYEVAVEVPDGPVTGDSLAPAPALAPVTITAPAGAAAGATTVPVGTGEPPATLLEIAAAIDAAETAEAGVVLGTAAGRPVDAGAGGTAGTGASVPAAAALPAGHGAAAGASAGTAASGGQLLSTAAPDFADVLAGLARAAGAHGSSAPGRQPGREPGRETGQEPGRAAAASAAPTSSLPKAVAAPVGAAAPPADAARSAADPRPFVPAVTTVPMVSASGPSGSPRSAGSPGSNGSPASPARDTTPPSLRPVRRPAAAGGLLGRLLDLGLPRDIAEAVEVDGDGGLHGGLVRALRDFLPATRPASAEPGAVLVVVGDGAAAYDVARQVAASLRLDQGEVLLVAPSSLATGVASTHRLSGPAAARRRAAELRDGDTAAVVAVDAPCDGTSAAWARDVADALGATAVWAVVDATRKATDLTDHVAALGRVDAVAVCGTAGTRDPGTVLELVLAAGLPTALVEERTGDPAAWATLLVERLGRAT